MKNKNIFTTFFLLCAATAYILMLGEAPPKEVKTDLWSGDMVEFRCRGKSPPRLDIPVSITPMAGNHYLVANYSSIFLLDGQTGDLTPMETGVSEKLNNCTLKTSRDLVFHPTGVFFSGKNNLLYVANYAGNNILVFSVSLEKKMLLFLYEIQSPHTISPENVFVSDDGTYLVCANYDGGSVTCFALNSTPFSSKVRELWNTPIGQAHGVCIAGQRVYATGLRPPGIFELDLKTGNILRRVGSPGWDPADNNVLWPTSIYPFSPGELMVSDAHTGFIAIIDRNSLKAKKYFGGNGPTYHFLNMPYAAITQGKQFVILSTFQGRILVGNKKSFTIEKAFIPDKKAWAHVREHSSSKPERLGKGWKEYIHENGPLITILGNSYRLGYGHLHPMGKGPTLTLSLKNDSLFNRMGSEFYFVQCMESKAGLLLFSPQSMQAYFITKGPMSYLFSVPVEKECWVLGDTIVYPRGVVDLEKIEHDAMSKAQGIEQKRLSSGLLRAEDLRALAYPEYDPSLFEGKLKNSFSSLPGKRFFDAYCQISARKSTGKEVEEVAAEYYAEIKQEAFVPIDEILLVHMLTGFAPSQ